MNLNKIILFSFLLVVQTLAVANTEFPAPDSEIFGSSYDFPYPSSGVGTIRCEREGFRHEIRLNRWYGNRLRMFIDTDRLYGTHTYMAFYGADKKFEYYKFGSEEAKILLILKFPINTKEGEGIEFLSSEKLGRCEKLY